MLLIVTLAHAGTWNICAAAEATSAVNAGWTIYDVRDGDGVRSADKGTFSAYTSIVQRWEPRREEDLCEASDGMGGVTKRLDTALVEVDSLPGEGACVATVWGNGYGDVGSRAVVKSSVIGGKAEGHAITSADAGNTGTIGVDGGGGARFTGEWAYWFGGTASVAGVVQVSASAAYNGAALDIPGWAQVDAYDGEVDGWVRRGAEWVHVTGFAPMDIPFGATVGGRGQVCAAGSATSGAHAEAGGQNAGGAGIGFTLTPARGVGPVDARPADGPEFEPCGC